MSSRLRAILSGGRVTKRRSTPTKKPPPPSPSSNSSPSRTPSARATTSTAAHRDEDDTSVLDHASLATNNAPTSAAPLPPPITSVPQALQHVREGMFAPLRLQGMGISSTRTAHILNFRASLPPLATTPHVASLMPSPTVAEREIAQLVRAGCLRRVVVPRRRGGVGEALIEVAALEALVNAAPGLSPAARRDFLAWLRGGPRGVLAAGRIPTPAADELVRAGFLTANVHGTGGGPAGLFARPEDRVTLMSLETVARAASGTAAAVGGEGAVHNAGGQGGRGGADGSALGDLSLAVPGNGAYLKLVAAALEHLESLLSRLPYREAPADLLRERWDGGAGDDGRPGGVRKARGQFTGPPPGRAGGWGGGRGRRGGGGRAGAGGAGRVEVFDTGSVGRAIRLT